MMKKQNDEQNTFAIGRPIATRLQSFLVLPNETTMRPELLSNLMQLARDGATIIGQAPKSSPSMQNFSSKTQ